MPIRGEKHSEFAKLTIKEADIEWLSDTGVDGMPLKYFLKKNGLEAISEKKQDALGVPVYYQIEDDKKVSIGMSQPDTGYEDIAHRFASKKGFGGLLPDRKVIFKGYPMVNPKGAEGKSADYREEVTLTNDDSAVKPLSGKKTMVAESIYSTNVDASAVTADSIALFKVTSNNWSGLENVSYIMIEFTTQGLKAHKIRKLTLLKLIRDLPVSSKRKENDVVSTFRRLFVGALEDIVDKL